MEDLLQQIQEMKKSDTAWQSKEISTAAMAEQLLEDLKDTSQMSTLKASGKDVHSASSKIQSEIIETKTDQASTLTVQQDEIDVFIKCWEGWLIVAVKAMRHFYKGQFQSNECTMCDAALLELLKSKVHCCDTDAEPKSFQEETNEIDNLAEVIKRLAGSFGGQELVNKWKYSKDIELLQKLRALLQCIKDCIKQNALKIALKNEGKDKGKPDPFLKHVNDALSKVDKSLHVHFDLHDTQCKDCATMEESINFYLNQIQEHIRRAAAQQDYEKIDL